jgi:hypothetical protein
MSGCGKTQERSSAVCHDLRVLETCEPGTGKDEISWFYLEFGSKPSGSAKSVPSIRSIIAFDDMVAWQRDSGAANEILA